MSRENPDIGSILTYYGANPLSERRGWRSMKCPFHSDTHASASVNTEEGAFCCFACQYKGNGYAIIMLKEGVQFREAITIAERILNASGKVLPQRNTRSGGLPRRTGNNAGVRQTGTLGRRARTANGS